VARLLDKNPATRISWEELPRHPFWGVPMPVKEMPEQPLLTKFLAQHGLLSVPSTDPRDVRARPT
jgi:hypothetical protein